MSGYWICEFWSDEDAQYKPQFVHTSEESARDCVWDPELESGRGRIVRVEVVEIIGGGRDWKRVVLDAAGAAGAG